MIPFIRVACWTMLCMVMGRDVCMRSSCWQWRHGFCIPRLLVVAPNLIESQAGGLQMISSALGCTFTTATTIYSGGTCFLVVCNKAQRLNSDKMGNPAHLQPHKLRLCKTLTVPLEDYKSS